MCVMVVVSSRFYVCDDAGGGGGGGGGVCVSVSMCMEWVVFIAIAWDETSILVAVHFSMKTFTSYVTGAEPWCGATLASDLR